MINFVHLWHLEMRSMKVSFAGDFIAIGFDHANCFLTMNLWSILFSIFHHTPFLFPWIKQVFVVDCCLQWATINCLLAHYFLTTMTSFHAKAHKIKFNNHSSLCWRVWLLHKPYCDFNLSLVNLTSIFVTTCVWDKHVYWHLNILLGILVIKSI